MFKRNVSYFLLGVLLLYLTKNTVAMKFLAPACYRMDLSMAVILSVAYSMTDIKKVWLLLGAKVLLQLLFGNPGIGIGFHLLLTVSDTLMDAMILCLLLYFQSRGVKHVLVKSCISSILYVVFCTMLNAVYHIRLYIAAYHTDLSSILSLAARYNDKVESYVSFLLWSVAPFYFVKFLLVTLFAMLLHHLFINALVAGEQREEE